MKTIKWYDFLWIWTIIYFVLGFFNILFAWMGMIDFIVPLLFAVIGGNKYFCNRYCGRGQLLAMLGKKGKCSRNQQTPKWMSSKWFRYGFLVFFLTMFGMMIFQTYLVVQFAFGFYSMMLTSTLIGLIVMLLYKPRTWCAFCPMGTMTQGICQIKNRNEMRK